MNPPDRQIAPGEQPESTINNQFSLFEDAVVPFSIAFTAGDLAISWGNRLYAAIEHATPHDPKTLLALGSATICSLVYNRIK